MNETTLTDTERETWLAGLRAAERVREVLADHFIMWRELPDFGGTPSGEWFCSCGLKFGFSNTAIDHQTAAVERIVAARVVDAVDRERAAWATKIEGLAKEWERDAPPRSLSQIDAGIRSATLQDARELRGLLAADDTEGKREAGR